jgi:hypothetical protein
MFGAIATFKANNARNRMFLLTLMLREVIKGVLQRLRAQGEMLTEMEDEI